MSSPNVDDNVDEVKVFRSSDEDILDTAQSSQQLSEDKKDVAYEAEMDTQTTNLSSQNIFFNPMAFSSTMFNHLPINNFMYPVFMVGFQFKTHLNGTILATSGRIVSTL